MSAQAPHLFLQEPAIQAFIKRARRRRIPARHTVLHSGDSPESLYLILEGSVSILAEDEDGREMVLAYRHAGEFFGEMCLFPHLDTRSALVRTRQETWVAELAFEGFRTFADEHRDIMFVLAGQLAVCLRDTSRRLADLNFLDVAGRMAHALLDLADQPDAVVTPRGKEISTSRQELARIVGCSREMAGRVLKSLEEDGLIESDGRRLLIIQPRSQD